MREIWPTYTNVVYANGVLAVPSYPTDDPRAAAALDASLRIYRDLLPGWTVVPVDSLALMLDGGALHCATINVYGQERRFNGR